MVLEDQDRREILCEQKTYQYQKQKEKNRREIERFKCKIQGNLRRRNTCLLYTSDAADELDGVDLGGRRIIKKKIF